jgi:hypothetical protein
MMELLYFPPKQFSPRYGDNVFTVNVENFERVKPIDSCASKFVVFVLVISRGRMSYTVKRRFSDFEKFLIYLNDKYPSTKQPFPALPPKTWVSVVGDDAFLSERAKELQKCIDELLTTMHIEKILTDERLTQFLEFNNFTSSSVTI